MEAKRKEADLRAIMFSECKVGKKIDEGSKGAAVFEGTYQFRNNIVFKRMKKMYIDTIKKEVMLLSELDSNPNILRYYGAAKDEKYLYIALDQCNCNLQDFVKVQENYIRLDIDIGNEIQDKLERNKLKAIKKLYDTKPIGMLSTKDKNLRIPTTQAINILREIMQGLSYIHKKNIIHRDLTVANILLKFEDNCIHAKIADFNYDNNGYGTFGWRAPEQINGNSQTAATDAFTFGCIVFYCITGGQHPFGNNPEECENNVKNDCKCNISSIEHILEAHHLVYHLLVSRLTIHQVELHPFFWNSKKRLEFLCAASDRALLAHRRDIKLVNNGQLKSWELAQLKLENKILDYFGSAQQRVFKGGNGWCLDVDQHLRNHKSNKCIYSCNRLTGLLRKVRNLSTHYDEQPTFTQTILGGKDGGLLDYFDQRFPRLFFEVYCIMHVCCSNESAFVEYFGQVDSTFIS